MNLLESLGWRADRASAPDPSLCPARVASQHPGLYDLLTARGPLRAMLRGNLLDDPPVVGDWVWMRDLGDQGLIESIAPRETVLQRRRVGGGRPQILCTNVQRVAAVCALDRDFNPRRLERYQAAARGAGCETRVVLTKADGVDDVRPFLEALTDEPIVVSALTGAGVDGLRAWIGTGTVVFVGSSGVGKSTLINALVGSEVRATGATTDRHGKGRHTTTSRDLIPLPDGGCVIDTPGMREFGLADDADASAVFDDIAALSTACAYRDCSHQQEPGCAILEAVASGELDADRLASFHKLQRELAWERRRSDKRLQAEQSREWGRMIRAVQKARKDRGY